MSKCIAIDRYSKKCNLSKLDGIDYCKFHNYLNDYTKEQLDNLTLCSGCNKWKFLENGDKTCQVCKARRTKNNLKLKNDKILCKKEGCKYKKSTDNDYCGLHQIECFKDETIKLGKKVCAGHLRGCREQLDMTYFFSKCEKCLIKERESDKKRRDVKNKIFNDKNFIDIDDDVNDKIVNDDIDDNIVDDIDDDNIVDNIDDDKSIDGIDDDKIIDDIDDNNDDNNDDVIICIQNIYNNIDLLDKKTNKIINHLNCFNDLTKFELDDEETELIKCSDKKCELFYLKKYFISYTNGSLTKRCQFCRDNGILKDSKESRKIVKQQWKENNYDKTAKYWMDYRGRKMKEKGEEYWKDNKEGMKIWRQNNKDKVIEINKKKEIILIILLLLIKMLHYQKQQNLI